MQLDWTNNGPTGAIEVSNSDPGGAGSTSNEVVHAANPGNTPGGGNDGAPVDTGAWNFDDTDVNANNVGEGGLGIAMRIELTAINNGVSVLSLSPNTLSQATWTDVNGTEIPRRQLRNRGNRRRPGLPDGHGSRRPLYRSQGLQRRQRSFGPSDLGLRKRLGHAGRPAAGLHGFSIYLHRQRLHR